MEVFFQYVGSRWCRSVIPIHLACTHRSPSCAWLHVKLKSRSCHESEQTIDNFVVFLMCTHNFIYRHVWICNKSSNVYMTGSAIRSCARVNFDLAHWIQDVHVHEYFGRHPKTSTIHFYVRHRVWRSWSFVKLHGLYTRLQLGVVPTYFLVNSWSSRSSSC